MRIMRLEGKKLGVVGFGRIGRAVADRARAFGLQVLVADPFVTAEAAQDAGAVKMELPELLGESDFVTLHSPLITQTQGMMGKDEFARMRPDAFLINAARGGLINEDALYDALTSGQIAGAGLDVLVDLDPPIDHRISQLENVIITPHTAFFSQEAVLELEERAAGEVVSIFQGKMPDNLVNPAVLDHSRAKIE